MRERELKPRAAGEFRQEPRSLPMRERELKLRHPRRLFSVACVAPHAGARIETGILLWLPVGGWVAPHVGAVSRVTQ